jgi:hypothetical protein
LRNCWHALPLLCFSFLFFFLMLVLSSFVHALGHALFFFEWFR